MRAYQRFDDRNGGFFAAGLTYYTIFALFPLLMVGFAVVGFALSRRPELLSEIDNHIRAAVPSATGATADRVDEFGDPGARIGRCHRPGDRGLGGSELDVASAGKR